MQNATSDTPKSLREPAAREARLNYLAEPHIAPLTEYVEELRRRTGKGYLIPYFDPFDGGINATCIFLFEAPGPKAVESGFVSRNNPDESAKNFFILNNEADLARVLTASWNIVPWYIGSEGRIRPANQHDIAQGLEHLAETLPMFPRLRAVVMGGKKAQRARAYLQEQFPALHLFDMPHPSPQYVNRAPGNRQRILEVLREVRESLLDRSADV